MLPYTRIPLGKISNAEHGWRSTVTETFARRCSEGAKPPTPFFPRPRVKIKSNRLIVFDPPRSKHQATASQPSLKRFPFAMTTPNDKVILYPAGGCFNRMRSEQTYLNDLLQSSFDGWEKAENKKQFVCEMILGKIPGGIWIHDRESGQAIRPERKDAENRILQVSIAGIMEEFSKATAAVGDASSLVGH
jgi:hypothetical protein